MTGVSVIFGAFLLASAPAPADATTPAPTAAKGSDEETVCRRIEVTGSLARKERVCKTRGEWRRLADRANDTARDIVLNGTGKPPGGP